MATEYLDIPNCPKCGEGHRYKLDVQRSIVMKALTTADLCESTNGIEFTRLFTCPNHNEDFQATFTLSKTSSSSIKSVKVVGIASMAAENDRVKIEPGSVRDVTPHNKALYEAGKKLLVDSIDIGREFCKFMTTTSLGAIPAYLALLKLVLPKDYSLQSHDELVFLSPPLLFLASAVLFVLGYFPQKGSLCLDLPDEIERERSATILRRRRFSVWGFIVFCVGIVFGSCVLLGKLLK